MIWLYRLGWWLVRQFRPADEADWELEDMMLLHSPTRTLDTANIADGHYTWDH